MWQPVLMISGYFISVLGLAMLIPAGVDIYYNNMVKYNAVKVFVTDGRAETTARKQKSF